MRNAEEFSGRRRGLTRMRPAYRRPGRGAGGRPSAGRIRYAHGGALPRVEPLRMAPPGPAGRHGGDVHAGGARDAAAGGDLGGQAWLAEFPVGRRHTDRWVLVGGGIAAAAAFAAAFVVTGSVASHPASPAAAVPAVVSQACPSPAANPAP